MPRWAWEVLAFLLALVVLGGVGLSARSDFYARIDDTQVHNCEQMVVMSHKITAAIEKAISVLPPGRNATIDQLRSDLAAIPDRCIDGRFLSPTTSSDPATDPASTTASRP